MIVLKHGYNPDLSCLSLLSNSWGPCGHDQLSEMLLSIRTLGWYDYITVYSRSQIAPGHRHPRNIKHRNPENRRHGMPQRVTVPVACCHNGACKGWNHPSAWPQLLVVFVRAAPDAWRHSHADRAAPWRWSSEICAQCLAAVNRVAKKQGWWSESYSAAQVSGFLENHETSISHVEDMEQYAQPLPSVTRACSFGLMLCARTPLSFVCALRFTWFHLTLLLTPLGVHFGSWSLLQKQQWHKDSGCGCRWALSKHCFSGSWCL